MGLKFERNFTLKNAARKLHPQLRKVLERELQFEVRKIVSRTLSGQDYKGRRFAQYAPSTRAYKLRTEGDTNVDLTETGTMLGAIQSRVEERPDGVYGIIYFSGGSYVKSKATVSSVARDHMLGRPSRNLPKREFFRLSDKQIQTIEREIRKAIEL